MKTKWKKKIFFDFFFFMSKQTKWTSSFSWLNEQTDLKKDKNTIYYVLLCLHVADPATFLASDWVLGSYFQKIYFWVNIITCIILLLLHFWIWISDQKLHHAPLISNYKKYILNNSFCLSLCFFYFTFFALKQNLTINFFFANFSRKKKNQICPHFFFNLY